MGQRKWVLLNILSAIFLIGCGKETPAPATAPTPPAARAASIVSLSPAASDLLVAMGLTDRIVGVSQYEADEDLRKRLPVVGDYLNVDWERIAQLKPGYMIVQGRPDRLPSGLKERADALGIKLVNIQIDRLDDIYKVCETIGTGVDAGDAGTKLAKSLRQQIKDANRASDQRTPALILIGERGTSVIGRDNYLNDLLEAAGGTNVVDLTGYPSVDREKLLTLRPDVIFVLLPGANDNTIADEKGSIESATELPAVRDHRVHTITSSDALLPATPVTRLVKAFSDGMRAPTTTGPASK
jgi:iron complex transport system substrate-binding protein